MLRDHLLHLLRDREQGIGAALGDHLRRELLEHERAGILDPVDAVPDAHDLLLPLDQILDVRPDLLHLADLREHVDHLLVGSAVQGARQRSDRGGDHGVGIGQRGCRDAPRERGSVHGVLGVEDEGGVHHAGHVRIRLLARDHEEEVLGVREVLARRHVLLAVAQAVVRRHQGRSLRDDPHRGGVAVGRVHGIAVGREHPQRRDRGLQGLHGVSGVRERLQEIDETEPDVPVRREILGPLLQLGPVGEFSPEEEEARLLEGAVLGQRLDGQAPVFQDSLVAVDEADARARRRHVGEPGHVGHGARCWRWGGCGALRHAFPPEECGAKGCVRIVLVWMRRCKPERRIIRGAPSAGRAPGCA